VDALLTFTCILSIYLNPMVIKPVGFFNEVLNMLKQDRYDSLIQFYTEKHTEFDWMLIKAVIRRESRFNRYAESQVGARGLMQLMSGTAKDMGMVKDEERFDVEWCIDAGIRYLWFLYGRYPEIPDEQERLKFALAAYNAGRGNINKALEIARDRDGFPASCKKWKALGSPPGRWQTWKYSKQFLKKVTGDYSKETLAYVAAIEKFYRKYRAI